jgi:signal transduction histidine kinase/ActR/RegA family two-component response regulator
VVQLLEREAGARQTSRVAVSLVAAIAASTLFGWAFQIERLKGFIPALPVMNPLTACCLMAAAVSLLLLLPPDAARNRKIFGRVLAAGVMLIGAVKLSSLASGWDLPIDQWLFPEGVNAARIPNRIPVRTAINLFLSGGALLLLDTRTRRGLRPAEILSAVSAIIGLLALLGYSYGLIALYRTATYEPMSLHGALAFILLSAGTLLARTDAGAMRIVVSDTAAGLLSRLLLPLGFLLPVLFGTLRLAGENAGWYTSRVGVALFATAFIIFFLVAVWWTVRALFRSDLNRRAAEERVRQLNAELEQRVADRTAELHLLNEELRQASKAKDNFLAVLSHELRTPLTPALAAAGYLAEHPDLPAELRDEANAIRTGVQLEARLIDDLLDLPRIARGKIELQLETVDAHEVIRKTLLIVHEDVRLNQLDVVLDLEASDYHVRADAVRLQQVFWNLLNNAVKFTAKGGRITLRSWNEAGRFALEVRDTGVGIQPELQKRIFSAFEQGDRSISRQFGGLGLGLTIAKTLLDLHGGTIAVRSEGKNRGASFQVTLNIIGRDEPPASGQETRFAIIGEGLDLLLVDDHAQTLRVLSGLLRKRGHKISTADSVKSALQLLENAKFDAVISDIGLPDGSGCDIIRAAKRQQAIQGIALSGFGMEEDICRGKEAGFDHYLTKPVDFHDLETCLGGISLQVKNFAASGRR